MFERIYQHDMPKQYNKWVLQKELTVNYEKEKLLVMQKYFIYGDDKYYLSVIGKLVDYRYNYNKEGNVVSKVKLIKDQNEKDSIEKLLKKKELEGEISFWK